MVAIGIPAGRDGREVAMTGVRRIPPCIWSDERLIDECLRGTEEAWAALIHKYKNLIYSIPIKSGLSRDDASEIFQQVCLSLVHELPHIRDPKSLAAWLIKVTSHACFQWAQREVRYQSLEPDLQSSSNSPAELVSELEREQMVRDVIAAVRPRCMALIHMLFFESPPLSYSEVAQRLNIAKDSVGFVRMRCLLHVRTLLEKKGF
jgi:RNA polymerase sigma factor (sigma-70 family)